MTKKILIATGVYPPESGGPATYTQLLEERLPALGFEVSVLPFRTVRHLPKIVRHLAHLFKCLHMARSADIVYALDTVSVGFPAALAAKVLGKKFVVRVPGDYAWEQARQRFGVKDELDMFQTKKYGWRVGLLRRIQRFVVRDARAVVVPSEYMKNIVTGWGVQNISVIYSSIDLAADYLVPANRPEGFLVVSSGRRVPWKGFDGIARAVSREKSWHFFLAENLPRAQALGWVKAADVFVLNSTYEGLSHALVEAMALGTPVVATAVGGNPELIEDKVDGLLVPPGDDEALYAAIKKVETDRESALARAQSARAKTGQFSIDTAVSKLAKLFRDMSPVRSLTSNGMRVLMITGDKNFVSSGRFRLQSEQVEKLEVVYVGKGSVWPKIPAGKFDVVTAQDPFWRGLFAWYAARRMGAKLNIQVHTSVLNPLGKFILRRADSVRVVSEKIKKQVESVGVKTPIRALPIYIDISKFKTIVRRPRESGSQEKTILWVGRFEEEKDPLYALEVITKVLKQVPGAKLIMLGVGTLQATLGDTVAKSGLSVEFPGWRDTADYLSVADVVLCTSKHESWGASIIEALAAGVPVVAPDVGVAREAGAVVVPREKLAEAVVEVLKRGARGELTLPLLTAEQWGRQWKETLV